MFCTPKRLDIEGITTEFFTVQGSCFSPRSFIGFDPVGDGFFIEIHKHFIAQTPFFGK